MKRDKRGRVRFSYRCRKFTLTELGLSVQPTTLCVIYWLADEKFRAKLAEAIIALDYPFVGTSIVIPRHMRAS
jgi:hypothetical protein